MPSMLGAPTTGFRGSMKAIQTSGHGLLGKAKLSNLLAAVLMLFGCPASVPIRIKGQKYATQAAY